MPHLFESTLPHFHHQLNCQSCQMALLQGVSAVLIALAELSLPFALGDIHVSLLLLYDLSVIDTCYKYCF